MKHGWVRLWRMDLGSSYYRLALPARVIWTELLLLANRDGIAEVGERLLSKRTGIARWTVRYSLNRLAQLGMIEILPPCPPLAHNIAHPRTRIKIVNWLKFQSPLEADTAHNIAHVVRRKKVKGNGGEPKAGIRGNLTPWGDGSPETPGSRPKAAPGPETLPGLPKAGGGNLALPGTVRSPGGSPGDVQDDPGVDVGDPSYPKWMQRLVARLGDVTGRYGSDVFITRDEVLKKLREDG